MRRRGISRQGLGATRLARHLSTRRAMARQVYRSTPMPFLQKIGLANPERVTAEQRLSLPSEWPEQNLPAEDESPAELSISSEGRDHEQPRVQEQRRPIFTQEPQIPESPTSQQPAAASPTEGPKVTDFKRRLLADSGDRELATYSNPKSDTSQSDPMREDAHRTPPGTGEPLEIVAPVLTGVPPESKHLPGPEPGTAAAEPLGNDIVSRPPISDLAAAPGLRREPVQAVSESPGGEIHTNDVQSAQFERSTDDSASSRSAIPQQSGQDLASQEPGVKRTESPAPAPRRPRGLRVQEIATGSRPALPSPRLAPRPPVRPKRLKGAAERPTNNIEAEAIFEPKQEVDRSPSAWRERLIEAVKREEEVRSTSESPADRAITPALQPDTPPEVLRHPLTSKPARSKPELAGTAPSLLPESTRRFLKPLVGFDARDIPVYQGPAISRVLAETGADAMAVADAAPVEESILLGSGESIRHPEQVGLIAHELTHLGHHRERGFVPPVARAGPASEVLAQPPADEESLAIEVEARVSAAAQQGKLESNVEAENDRNDADELNHQSGHEVHGRAASRKAGGTKNWGGLPAPWEPMPSWMREGPDLASQSFVAAQQGDSVAAQTDAAAAPPMSVAAAEISRTVPERQQGHTPNEKNESEGNPVAPDLDSLARKVYAIMRRRLASDRRREFMSEG